jgi:hypothetical protein
MPGCNSLSDYIVRGFNAPADFLQHRPLPRFRAVSIGKHGARLAPGKGEQDKAQRVMRIGGRGPCEAISPWRGPTSLALKRWPRGYNVVTRWACNRC